MKLNCQAGIFCISAQFPLATVAYEVDNSHPLLWPGNHIWDYFYQEAWKQILGGTFFFFLLQSQDSSMGGAEKGTGPVRHFTEHTIRCAVLLGNISFSLMYRKGTRELHPQPVPNMISWFCSLWTSRWPLAPCAVVQNHVCPLKPGPTASTDWSKSICTYINKSYNTFILWASSTRII